MYTVSERIFIVDFIDDISSIHCESTSFGNEWAQNTVMHGWTNNTDPPANAVLMIFLVMAACSLSILRTASFSFAAATSVATDSLIATISTSACFSAWLFSRFLAGVTKLAALLEDELLDDAFSADIAASFFLPPPADTASVTSAIDLFFSTSIAFFSCLQSVFPRCRCELPQVWGRFH